MMKYIISNKNNASITTKPNLPTKRVVSGRVGEPRGPTTHNLPRGQVVTQIMGFQKDCEKAK